MSSLRDRAAEALAAEQRKESDEAAARTAKQQADIERGIRAWCRGLGITEVPTIAHRRQTMTTRDSGAGNSSLFVSEFEVEGIKFRAEKSGDGVEIRLADAGKNADPITDLAELGRALANSG